jgi:hypothetical protein
MTALFCARDQFGLQPFYGSAYRRSLVSGVMEPEGAAYVLLIRVGEYVI